MADGRGPLRNGSYTRKLEIEPFHKFFVRTNCKSRLVDKVYDREAKKNVGEPDTLTLYV